MAVVALPRVESADGICLCPVQLPSVGTFRIAVGRREIAGTAPFGRDPISEAIARTGTLPSENLVRLMLGLTRPGQLVVDLGAHVGQFSLSAAAANRAVFAVEASLHNLTLLRAGVSANGFTRVELVHAAASNEPGELRFHEAGPYGGVLAEGGQAGTAVPAIRVGDRLARQSAPVGFIKLDVEGHEIEAVEGLADWLGGYPGDPPILYESNLMSCEQRGRSRLALRHALQRLGYEHHYLASDSRLVRVNDGDPQPIVVADYLATKKPVSAPEGWRLDPALSARVFRRLLLADLSAYWENPGVLCCLGRALQACSSSLTRDQRVQLHLGHVAHAHPDAVVRAAFATWLCAWAARAWKRERTRLATDRLLRRLADRLHPGVILRRFRAWRQAA